MASITVRAAFLVFGKTILLSKILSMKKKKSNHFSFYICALWN